MLIWQRMTGTALGRAGVWGETTWGSFPLDLDAHIGLGLFLLTVRFWWTSKKPQACKHNKAHEEWNMTLSCHNTIKWALKNFPASFILSKYAREKHELCCLSDFVFFLLHEKELSFQSLILANKKSLPVARHIRKRFRHFKYKENDTGHTATSGRPLPSGRHYP